MKCRNTRNLIATHHKLHIRRKIYYTYESAFDYTKADVNGVRMDVPLMKPIRMNEDLCKELRDDLRAKIFSLGSIVPFGIMEIKHD